MGSDRRCGGVGEFLAAPCGGVIATGLDNIGTRSSCVSNQDIALRNIRQVVFQMPDGLGGGGLFSRIVEVAGCVLEGRSQDLEILAGNDGAGGMIGNPSDRSEGLMRVDLIEASRLELTPQPRHEPAIGGVSSSPAPRHHDDLGRAAPRIMCACAERSTGFGCMGSMTNFF